MAERVLITGGAGNDFIDGGAGDDTAVFNGNAADYRIVYSEGYAYIDDLNLSDGDDGVDSLYNVEHVQFADATIDVGPEPLINGVAAGDRAGTSVAGIGDINKDGFDDFIIGAPGVSGNSGAAYVVFGGAGGLPPALSSDLTLRVPTPVGSAVEPKPLGGLRSGLCWTR